LYAQEEVFNKEDQDCALVINTPEYLLSLRKRRKRRRPAVAILFKKLLRREEKRIEIADYGHKMLWED